MATNLSNQVNFSVWLRPQAAMCHQNTSSGVHCVPMAGAGCPPYQSHGLMGMYHAQRRLKNMQLTFCKKNIFSVILNGAKRSEESRYLSEIIEILRFAQNDKKFRNFSCLVLSTVVHKYDNVFLTP